MFLNNSEKWHLTTATIYLQYYNLIIRINSSTVFRWMNRFCRTIDQAGFAQRLQNYSLAQSTFDVADWTAFGCEPAHPTHFYPDLSVSCFISMPHSGYSVCVSRLRHPSIGVADRMREKGAHKFANVCINVLPIPSHRITASSSCFRRVISMYIASSSSQAKYQQL